MFCAAQKLPVPLVGILTPFWCGWQSDVALVGENLIERRAFRTENQWITSQFDSVNEDLRAVDQHLQNMREAMVKQAVKHGEIEGLVEAKLTEAFQDRDAESADDLAGMRNVLTVNREIVQDVLTKAQENESRFVVLSNRLENFEIQVDAKLHQQVQQDAGPQVQRELRRLQEDVDLVCARLELEQKASQAFMKRLDDVDVDLTLLSQTNISMQERLLQLSKRADGSDDSVTELRRRIDTIMFDIRADVEALVRGASLVSSGGGGMRPTSNWNPVGMFESRSTPTSMHDGGLDLIGRPSIAEAATEMQAELEADQARIDLESARQSAASEKVGTIITVVSPGPIPGPPPGAPAGALASKGGKGKGKDAAASSPLASQAVGTTGTALPLPAMSVVSAPPTEPAPITLSAPAAPLPQEKDGGKGGPAAPAPKGKGEKGKPTPAPAPLDDSRLPASTATLPVPPVSAVASIAPIVAIAAVAPISPAVPVATPSVVPLFSADTFSEDLLDIDDLLASSAEEDAEPPEWEKFFDDDLNRDYYYNQKSKQTLWEPPPGFVGASFCPPAKLPSIIVDLDQNPSRCAVSRRTGRKPRRCEILGRPARGMRLTHLPGGTFYSLTRYLEQNLGDDDGGQNDSGWVQFEDEMTGRTYVRSTTAA